MNITHNSKPQLEILVATMYRTSLDFLEAMFSNSSKDNYHILIINQTTEDQLLSSKYDNIRVINSFEKGLSQSRNLAIKNAIGEICLIADDDVVYTKTFETDIIKAHQKYESADLITFQMTDDEGHLYRNYPSIVQHSKETVNTANSIVISFKRERLLESNVLYNTNFGLGTQFPTGDEFVFLRNGLEQGLIIYFEPVIILSHPKFSSGKDLANDKVLYARAALFYKYSGILGYLRLIKHVYALKTMNRIHSNDFWKKLKVGLKGIKDYKQLIRTSAETR